MTFATSDVTVDLVGESSRPSSRLAVASPTRAGQGAGYEITDWAAFRPDILGSVAVGHEGGAYTMAIYFTSEAEAREGERKEPPPELQAEMEEMGSLSVGEPEFFDLKQPWLYGPR